MVSAVAKATRDELALPAIVAYELEYGTLQSALPERRRKALQVGLGSIRCVPFDSEAALAAAGVRIELERKGLTIGPMDLLIAGTALSREALLVTNNTDEFSRIAGLRIADWKSK
jgi:tRNA(fMet)-specific endonuclease VapC